MNKIEIFNETKEDINYAYLNEVINKTLEIEKISKVEFNIILVDNNYIKKINREYRDIDKETDVISFAFIDSDLPLISDCKILGDIYISLDKVKEHSVEYNHSFKRELSFLTVHGILHLLGYDHMNEEESQTMFERQEYILNECNIRRY